MSVQRIVEDTPPIEMQAETQYDETEPPVRPRTCLLYVPVSLAGNTGLTDEIHTYCTASNFREKLLALLTLECNNRSAWENPVVL